MDRLLQLARQVDALERSVGIFRTYSALPPWATDEQVLDHLKKRLDNVQAVAGAAGADPHRPPPGYGQVMTYMRDHPGMTYEAAQAQGGR